MVIAVSFSLLIISILLYLKFKRKEGEKNIEIEIPLYNNNELEELENKMSDELCETIIKIKVQQEGMVYYVSSNFDLRLKEISFNILRIGLWKTFNKQIITYYYNNSIFIEENSRKFLDEFNSQIFNKIFFQRFKSIMQGGPYNYDSNLQNLFYTSIHEDLFTFVHNWIIDFSNRIKEIYKLKLNNDVANQLLLETNKGNELLEKMANEGNVDSQYNLGTLHFKNGNFTLAKFWYEKAAENGEMESQYQLGNMYFQGIGLKKDIKKALFWYLKAAISNHPKAQYNIGLFYLQGEIIKQDENEAMHWLNKAANNGYNPAIELLKQI